MYMYMYYYNHTDQLLINFIETLKYAHDDYYYLPWTKGWTFSQT